MNKILALSTFVILLVISVVVYPNGFLAILVCVPFIAATLFAIRKFDLNSNLLVQIFLVAFLLRILAATFIYSFDLQYFFGEDSLVHEFHGFTKYEVWAGYKEAPYYLKDWAKPWGLHSLIAAVYTVIGRNPLAIQFISCAAGAATAVLTYFCTFSVFKNYRAAKVAGIFVAVFPAMIIWSAQIMKDGFMVFLVILCIYLLIKLQEKFTVPIILLLILTLFGILTLRFYVFYFALFTCVGSFIFGSERVVANNLKLTVVIGVIVLVLSYTGVATIGKEQIERLSDLESIQYSRSTLARDASSGFSGDTDIRTVSGALTAFPVGLTFLLLAPFPWSFGSLRSALPLPEMLVWWVSVPFIFTGFKYTFLNKFKKAIPILLFTVTLTIVYALFQTNVGTAYRQRTQIQVFLFIFIAVGWTLWQEKKENLRLQNAQRKYRGPTGANQTVPQKII